MGNPTIRDLLTSDDPLSDAALALLLSHKEEDTLVDYKEAFDLANEKEWLGITVDVMAFANTEGGYIVFGVRDVSFDHVGLDEQTSTSLSNTSLVLQKLNRFVAPAFSRVRTKRFLKNERNFVIFYIPEFLGQTHIVVKEGAFFYPSGERKVVLRPGMIFIRHTATNHVVTPEDLDFVIRRRIEHYKSDLLGKIARVVEAPPQHQVLVFDPRSPSEAEDSRSFVISDAPEAIPIAGLSFTVSPKTDEQEISSWIALVQKDPEFVPRGQQLWRLYSKRHELTLSTLQLASMVQFCLVAGVPSFFWLQGLGARPIKDVLADAATKKCSITEKERIVHTAAFLGRGFHGDIIRKLGKVAGRLPTRSRKFPASGPRDFFAPHLIESRRKSEFRGSEVEFRIFLDAELTKLAIDLAEDRGGAIERTIAHAIDCYLYARDDRYQGKGPGTKT